MGKGKYEEIQKELTAEEAAYWIPILEELDREEKNNDRRHASHRDSIDLTIADRDPKEGEEYRIADMLKLSHCEDWLEIIFSQQPEDLYQLVEEYPTSEALKELTDLQKTVLLENVVYGISAKDIAEEFGCSTRNITKHRQKALERIRYLVTGNEKLEIEE